MYMYVFLFFCACGLPRATISFPHQPKTCFISQERHALLSPNEMPMPILHTY